MDFYCPELKLCIEIDGNIHEQTEAFAHDIKRTDYLNSQGITVFRYSNDVVFNQPGGIIDSIKKFKENPNIIYGYILNNEITYKLGEKLLQSPPNLPLLRGGIPLCSLLERGR